MGLAGNREGRCARLSDATSRQMDIDDRIHLIGATQRLVDALAEQCDRARRGGEQVKEALEIGRGQIARVRHALQIVTNVDPFQKTFRSEEHTSELQSLMRISYAVFCLKKKKKKN